MKENQLEKYRKEVISEIKHWKDISKNGCNDPLWPDGCNMNLVRNHIIYAKRKMAELCSENNIPLPEEYYFSLPPKVDEGYMANLKQKERVNRLVRSGNELVIKKVKYDEYQMSLF